MSENLWMHQRVRAIHCVGVGGSGMSGIAEVLHNLGFTVTGSDLSANKATERLRLLGVTIAFGHDSELLLDADVVVCSSAISADNPEIIKAREHRIPVIARAQMLAELMRFKHGIAVAGTHGKTTTTSMLAHILAGANLDPTYVIGGRVNHTKSHAGLGAGPHFIAEADESDSSFLLLQPMIGVITNIDQDHLATYQHDLVRLQQAFISFLHHLPFYGLAVLNQDDPGVCAIIDQVASPVLTYGTGQNADVRLLAFEQQGLQSRFSIKSERFGVEQELTIPTVGQHNVYNALSAITVALELQIDIAVIAQAIANFSGVARRSQYMGEYNWHGQTVSWFDDYGHHPQEISATYQAVQSAFAGRRVVLAFQPHRFSRTWALFEDFVRVLSGVDLLLLADVYPAGESPIAGADSRALCRAIRQRNPDLTLIYVEDISNLPVQLSSVLRNQDVLITQGAGSIGKLSAQQLANSEPALEAGMVLV